MACLAVQDAAIYDKHVLIVSNKDDAAKHIIEYAWDFIHPLIDHEQIKRPDVDQQGFIRWGDGGEIRCQSASENAGRGFDVHTVILDECAHFIKEIDLDRRIYRSIVPTLKPDGRMIILSTPRGTKNLFYDLWDKMPEDRRITIHWTECPDLVKKVRVEEQAFGKRYFVEDQPFDEADFRQEFCNDFYVGSDEAIPLEALRAALMKEGEEPPASGWTWISMGEDVGFEHDATAFVVIGRHESGVLWILESREMRPSVEMKYSFADFTKARAEIVDRRKVNRIVIDKTFNPQSAAEALIAYPGIVEPFGFTHQSKRELIGKASSFFTPGLVKCPERFRQALDEIANIKKVTGDAGGVLYKDKPHGDIGWACLLALWGIPQEVHVSDETMTNLGAAW